MLGSIYLLIFITIGAFIFANLVVAVVVTNLVSPAHCSVRVVQRYCSRRVWCCVSQEWAIAEQKELEVKQKHSKPETG